jgi:ribonuclease E
MSGSGADTPAQAAPPPAAPPQEPAITEVDETVNATKPRKSGWWSRRFG